MSWKQIAFALCNQGLMDNVDEAIREEHPSWKDKKVETERNKILKKSTMYNEQNKKPKKPKKAKKPKKEKEVKATTKVKKEKNK